MDNTVSKIEELLRGGSVEELKQFLEAFLRGSQAVRFSPRQQIFWWRRLWRQDLKCFMRLPEERAVENLQEHLEFHGHTMVGRAGHGILRKVRDVLY